MLRESIRTLTAAVLRGPAAVTTRIRPGVRILMYHRVDALPSYDQLTVSPQRFREQMKALAATGRVVPLSAAVNSLKRGENRNVLAITFDDGYLDNLTYALPILREFSLPATIFVTTEFCDQKRNHPRYSRHTGALHLDWNDVRSLAADPLITIGSHTRSHPYLTRVDAVQAEQEIRRSREEIEAQIGRPVQYFCYPSGDCTDREVEIARASGYEAAVTVAPGINRQPVDLFRLNRTEVTDRDTEFQFASKLDGAFDALHSYLHRRRLRAFASARQTAVQSLSGG
jgi:peptidoglycan/xylan/chitin deacetylase (PgdA/CDA1 family)